MLPSTADTVSASCFAELLAKLDYLEPNEIQQVRAAYQVPMLPTQGSFARVVSRTSPTLLLSRRNAPNGSWIRPH